MRYIDGNSQGCRYLHAVFALKNPFHCAHVSLIPAVDPDGDYICHWSAELSPEEMFTQTEVDGLFDLSVRNPEVARIGSGYLGSSHRKQSTELKEIQEVGKEIKERKKEKEKKYLINNMIRRSNH